MISYNNNNGGQLIKLYDCTWRGLIKSRDSEGMEMTAGHNYLYVDILKCENLKPPGHTLTYSSTCPQIF